VNPFAPTSARLVLASTSPRRRLLLREAGFEAQPAHPGVDDGPMRPGAVSPRQWTSALAYLKARACLESLGGARDGATILAADTVVVKDGRIIGQPRDREDARSILRTLRNGEHEVVTGVAIVTGSGSLRSMWSDAATVRVGTLCDAEIDQYLDSGQWAGKAGAYNLSERITAGWPVSYEGDPCTVMGLPMLRLTPMLEGLGVARAAVGPPPETEP
jgi:septum formation protein